MPWKFLHLSQNLGGNNTWCYNATAGGYLRRQLLGKTDAQLYDAWKAELAQQSVDVALVASLETEASERGFDLRTLDPITAGWDPNLHPRGRDGRFIDILGLVKLFNYHVDLPDGQGKKSFSEGRGRVVDIVPDKNSSEPWVIVEVGNTGIADRFGRPVSTRAHKKMPKNLGQ